MKNCRNYFLPVLLLSLIGVANAQSWKESTGTKYEYDLSGISILTVLYEGFNYNEAFDISEYWKSWGAKVDVAGTQIEQHGERNNPTTGRPHDMIPVSVNPEILLKEAEISTYDLIYFPGGEGVYEFSTSYSVELKKIIDNTIDRGKFIAAICHSPYLLAVSERIAGHLVTVQGNEFKPGLIKAGAKVVNEVFVSDGKFLTGQWPYFETFATSVAKALSGYDLAPGPQDMLFNNPALVNLGNAKKVWYMKSRNIPEDTVRIIMSKSINPQLPLELFNNNTLRIIAVKDNEVKSKLVDEIIEANKAKFNQENTPESAMKNIWTQIFNAPYIIFIYNDFSEIDSIPDGKEKELQKRIYSVLAGESVSQLIITAKALGYGTSTLGGMRTFVAEEGFRQVLGLSAGFQLQNIVGLGFPEEYANPPVKRPLDEYLIIK